MDTVYDMRSGIWAMLNEAFMYRINQIRIKKKTQKQSVLSCMRKMQRNTGSVKRMHK